MSSSNGEKRNEKLRKRSSQSRDRKRMRSDESLNNDCSLKKKNVWAIWIVLGETQSNSNKAGTGNQNNPLFYSFGAYVSNDSINDFSQNTILSNIVYDVKLFSTIIRENDSTMETSLKKFQREFAKRKLMYRYLYSEGKKSLVCLSFLIFDIFFSTVRFNQSKRQLTTHAC